MLLVSILFVVVGIVGIAIGLIGLGNWTIVACVVAVALITVQHVVAALRRRPRLVMTPDGFVLEKLWGRDAHSSSEIEDRFVVIKVGWNQAVAYDLTPEYKARSSKKPSSLYSGHDAARVGIALPCSAAELARLLNEYKQRDRA
jgi:hypothetical protein